MPSSQPSPTTARDEAKLRLGFVGAGRAGTALAVELSRSGETVAAVASRSYASARALAIRIPGCEGVPDPQEVVRRCELVFLTVPDDAIVSLVESLTWRSGLAVVHCSGAAGRELLERARQSGAATGTFHPLQTFSSAGAPAHLQGCTIAIEAEEPLHGQLSKLAEALGGRPLTLPPGSRSLYHTSATMASNFLVALLAGSAELWTQFGLSADAAIEALLPLIRATVDNIEQLGPTAALTGPIARGDVGTVRRQVEALRTSAPNMIGLYRELALLTMGIAVKKGTLTPAAEEQLQRILTELATEQGRH